MFKGTAEIIPFIRAPVIYLKKVDKFQSSGAPPLEYNKRLEKTLPSLLCRKPCCLLLRSDEGNVGNIHTSGPALKVECQAVDSQSFIFAHSCTAGFLQLLAFQPNIGKGLWVQTQRNILCKSALQFLLESWCSLLQLVIFVWFSQMANRCGSSWHLSSWHLSHWCIH